MKLFDYRVIMACIVGLCVVSCTDYAGLKNDLQAEYDRMNESGDQAICYDIEDLVFPYTAYPAEDYDSGYIQGNKERLAEKLPLFSELGLLSRTEVSRNPVVYRYDLTDEGRKYHLFDPIPQPYSPPINKNYFCYGRRIIVNVTDVEERTITRDARDYIQVQIRYNYQLENIPEWALSPALAKQYRVHTIEQEGQTYPELVELRKLNGSYYNDGGLGRLSLR